MADQHKVEFGDFSLTRLPIGRAEGRLFVVFVRAGRNLLAGDDPEDRQWRVMDFVRFDAGGRPLTSRDAWSGSGGDEVMTHMVEFVDSGVSSVTITYVEHDQVLGEETVELPAP